MKIVLFNKQEKAGGGIGVVTKRLKDFLEKKGHDVFEIRYTNEPENNDFFKVPYIYASKNVFIFLPSLDSKKIIEKHLKVINPDLVYLPIGSSMFDLVIPRICQKMGITLVGICHTDISRSSWISTTITSLPFRFYLPVVKQLGRLQVFTKELKEFYVKQGVNENKIVVIPNCVDQKKYCPGNSKFKKDEKITKAILFMGRITWIKNPEILIKSFLQIADKNTKLIFMGTGDLASKLKHKYSDPRVIFLGHVSDENRKIDVIRACDVFVLPSRYEGMSLSLLEAMSCGLCCVATDVASHKEVLDNVGIVLDPRCLKEDLPATLKKLVDNNKTAENMGRKARQRVLKYYSQDAVFSKISKEFVNLTKNN